MLTPKRGKGQEKNQYHCSVCQGRAGNSGNSCHQLEGLQTALQTRGHWAEKVRYYGCEGTRLLPNREREVGQTSQEYTIEDWSLSAHAAPIPAEA